MTATGDRKQAGRVAGGATAGGRPALAAAVAGALVVGMLVGAVAMGWTRAGQAPRAGGVGYVDFERVMEEILADPVRQETERLQKEFDEKSKGLKDAERQQLFERYQQMLDRRVQELGSAQLPRVRDAIQAVAQDQGLDLVLHKNAVIWGGQDITARVLSRLGVRIAPDRPSGANSSGAAPSGSGSSGSSSSGSGSGGR
ncbi:MAG TPA: OmpH family outer membrane protein [Limnochordales bacterium]